MGGVLLGSRSMFCFEVCFSGRGGLLSMGLKVK